MASEGDAAQPWDLAKGTAGKFLCPQSGFYGPVSTTGWGVTGVLPDMLPVGVMGQVPWALSWPSACLRRGWGSLPARSS